MATVHFGGTDRKVFTPISSALGALPNGPGTMVVLLKKTVLGNQDYVGLTDSGLTTWYHGLTQDTSDFLYDDDSALVVATAAATDDTTNWWLYAVDWPSGTAQVERFHWRNQTSAGAWTHSNSTGNNTGQRAGPGTGGWLRLGYFGDEATGAKDYAVCAIWAGTRFTDSDYGSWTKTSDLYNHPLGPPTFLCELTAATLVDLIGGSTYSSANSSGTTLTGADPANWTMDGVGSGGSGLILPRRYVNPNRQRLRAGPRALVERRLIVTTATVTTPQSLTATATSTATVTRQTGKPVTATAITTTAAITRQVGKAATATATATASMIRQVAKPVVATTVTVSASVTALKGILRTLTATTVNVTGSIVKQVGKSLTATAVTSTASTVRQAAKALTATVTVTASQVAQKVILKALTATATVSAALVKQAGKPLTAGTVTVAASMVKQTAKGLTATTVTVSAVLTALKVFLRVLTATVTPSATITRQVAKPLTVAVAATASIVRQIGKPLTRTVTLSASLLAQRVFPRTLVASTVTVTASMTRRTGKALTATVTVAGSFTKRTAKAIQAGVLVTAAVLTDIGSLIPIGHIDGNSRMAGVDAGSSMTQRQEAASTITGSIDS